MENYSTSYQQIFIIIATIHHHVTFVDFCMERNCKYWNLTNESTLSGQCIFTESPTHRILQRTTNCSYSIIIFNAVFSRQPLNNSRNCDLCGKQSYVRIFKFKYYYPTVFFPGYHLLWKNANNVIKTQKVRLPHVRSFVNMYFPSKNNNLLYLIIVRVEFQHFMGFDHWYN